MALKSILPDQAGSCRTSRCCFRNHLLFLLSLVLYSIAFLLILKFKNSAMTIAVLMPVVAAGWVYGRVAGIMAGFLSLPLNFAMCELAGCSGMAVLQAGTGLLNTAALLFIGFIAGHSGMLRSRLETELLDKQILRGELQASRQSLEQQVSDRTAELSAALQRLSTGNKELQEREQALAANEERLRSVVDTALDAILTIDSSGKITGWNKSAERIYGYSDAEMIGAPVTVIMPQRFHSREAEGLRDAVEQGKNGVFYSRTEGVGLRKDGTEFPTEVFQSVWKSGDEVFATGIVRDITQRKKAEEALLEREERLRAIVESALDAIITTDSQGRIVSWNRAAERIFGFSEAEMLGRQSLLLLPERARGNLDSLRAAFWREGVQASSEMVGLKKDGTELPLEVTRALWSGGKQIFATAIVRDITERKNAERDRMLLSTVIEQANENIIIMDAQGVILYANPALVRLVEQPIFEILGKNLFQPGGFLHEEKLSSSIYEQLQSGKAWKGVLSYKLKKGKTASVEQVLSPVFGAESRLINILSVSRDVTREQNLEEQLRQSQKMEAIGTLAGGIAHDFNNILSAIMGYTELAAMDVPGDSIVAERLRRVINSCDRARSLVKQILTFSRKNPQEPSPVRINNSIREAVRLLRASLPSTIEIRQDIQDPEAVVMADPTQLHQLILNLCTNAAQAMEETGGILSLGLNICSITNAEELSFCYDLPPDSYVRLIIRDTGPGISPEIKERIFEPFFTTKAVGKGTGMGLAVAHGIVKSYGGCIYAESEPGRGAAFHVLLPRINEVLPELRRVHRPSMPRGTETILLVDDEEPVVKTCEGMLSALGYTVVGTLSSVEALELFAAQPERFDCVITDMTMPCMRGDVLACKLMELRPGQPVILCTGFSEKISELQALEQGISAFLLKPHTMQELAVAVRKAIDQMSPMKEPKPEAARRHSS